MTTPTTSTISKQNWACTRCNYKKLACKGGDQDLCAPCERCIEAGLPELCVRPERRRAVPRAELSGEIDQLRREVDQLRAEKQLWEVQQFELQAQIRYMSAQNSDRQVALKTSNDHLWTALEAIAPLLPVPQPRWTPPPTSISGVSPAAVEVNALPFAFESSQ
ncbi:hypothetical protein EXIGLDRAFT_695246 [Exidia glandulosa HHB12029]|uniref:Zn(2)-C6 fungal-type domain-containing protein n=1 Tax=Exidia glandulosa HHB12029 TaxID=1314781 RepID=A0A165G2Q8_EXIGL|nr:hypothetical protein EXIGLDRAFT_695246 [Exidia glandulosa HHB12029]